MQQRLAIGKPKEVPEADLLFTLEHEPKPKMRIAHVKPRPAPTDDDPPVAAREVEPGERPPAAETTSDGGWREVVRLAKTGLDTASIADRLRLHPSEVEFILKVDARR